MSFKPIDPKRDEIRRYLERGNVLESLTKIFIRVIKERPENPMDYIRNNIGIVRHQHDKYERLQRDLQSANEEIRRLRGLINNINPDVLQQQGLEHDSDQEIAEQTAFDTPSEAKNAVESAEGSAPIANEDDELATAVDKCQLNGNQKTDANQNASASVQIEGTNSGNAE